MRPMTFAMKLKALRTAQGLTQTGLAARMKRKQEFVAQLESGEQDNPTLHTLKRVARALGTTVAELVQ